MEAHLSFHRGNKNAPSGFSGDLPWNKLGYYFSPSKKEKESPPSLPKRVWNFITLRFNQRTLEDNFDDQFCHQNIYRCRVVIVFMITLFLLHFILEVSISDLPQNQFASSPIRRPPLWSSIIIVVTVLMYGGYMMFVSRSQRFFFTRAMHVLMVSAVFVVGFALLCITILLKDISPPTTFIVLFCGIYISPPTKLPITASACFIFLFSLSIFLLAQGALSPVLKFTYVLLLLLANMLGVAVLTQTERTVRHEFMQIYNTKVEFRDLIKEQNQWESLISAILPIPIVQVLRDKKQHVSKKHDDVSILIAELVDFETHISSVLSPEESVVFLNRIFSIFERLVDNHTVEKIKSIGPVIIIAGGLNVHNENHLQSMVDLGNDMLIELDRLSKRIPLKLMLRIAITAGEVVDGVVGRNRVSYDVWGDPVTTGFNLMKAGTIGRIHVPFTLCTKLHTQYICEDNGEIDIRSEGKMRTAYILQRKNSNSDTLALHFLPPLFTTLEKKLGHLNMGAEMQTKDQAPDHPFRRAGIAKPLGAHASFIRKHSNLARPSSPVPVSKPRHIKITPVQQSPVSEKDNFSTWPDQMERLLSTNIAGTAREPGSIDSGLVVDRDFFSKWTLRYHHEGFEKQYHLYRASVNGKDSFLAIIFGAILNACFGLTTLLLAPSYLVPRLAIIEFGIVIPLTLLSLALVRLLNRKLGRVIHFIACALAGLSAAGVLACAWVAQEHIPHVIFAAQYALVIMYAFLLSHIRFLYFAALYAVLLIAYVVVVATQRGEMMEAFPWGLMAVVVLGGLAVLMSYKTEQLVRTEWLLINMGERSKRKREKQKETVVGLLGNILPQKVVQRLKEGHASTFAEDFQNCTVMWVTINDFGTLFDILSPTDLVETLDTLFSGFDDIVTQFPNLTKIKTASAAYMVVGGASDQSSDHAQQMVDCALKIVQMTQKLSVRQGMHRLPISVLVGIHSGLVHAGLIGWTKMIYDMWGETVNIAGVCAIHGMKDSIQATQATYSQLHTFNFLSDPSLISLSSSEAPLSTFILTAKPE